ncbi:Bromodomain containing protein [Trema orientale]|uniref:Bromodomain containing protein n=1 Tax=Trema orientale TaxID=63057 RepID=A0A2P5BBK6_TREOI|nr:Bromodomain containing protein [Trema orientale]
MARKLGKSKSKEGNRRRSPRIRGLDDAWKAHRPRRVALTCAVEMECNSHSGNPQGPASRTRSRNMGKLGPLQHVASPPPKQGDEKPRRNEDHQPAIGDQWVLQDQDSKNDENQDSWSTVPSKPWLPEKRVLELILDILQRKDAQEIFAEPVDPNEVEDYYDIIKEPMDFGTMRAKLHEGMYKNLEQFERDVFLITKNAMHFNSSATIYFRQARSINELATKVFHILKTYPESFELEYLKSRRRNGRRPRGESGNSLHKTRPKITRNVKSSGIVTDESSKSMPCSLSTSLNIRRRIPVTDGYSDITSHLDAINHEVPCGAGDDRTRSFESDRRYTYQPWTSFLGEDESVIQQDIGYKESLMSFVEDLGPVVQMIAKQKLLGWFPLQKTPLSMTSNNIHSEPVTLDPVIIGPTSQNCLDQVHGHPTVAESSSERMDLEDTDKIGKTCLGSKMGSYNSTFAAEFSCERKTEHGLKWGEVQDRSDTTIPSFRLRDNIHHNQSIDTQLCPYSILARAGEINSSFAGFKNTGNKSTTLIDQAELEIKAHQLKPAFEHSHSSLLKLRNMDASSFGHSESSTSKLSSWHLGGDQGKAELGMNYVVSSLSEAGRAMTLDQFKPSTSPFIFDLSFLRARLGQTNSLGQDTFL